MKATTGLLVGISMLLSSVAGAQYYPQASISGFVLSEGPQGFMLQGYDGNYGIAIVPSTVITDPWNSIVTTGSGNVLPGDYVTATGYPTSQWIMQATQVVVRNGNPPLYNGYGGYGSTYGSYGIGTLPGAGIARTPNVYPLLQQGITTSSTFTNRFNNSSPPLPSPHLATNPFVASTARR